MLTGTDLPPDHIVGKMIPRLGKATVEKMAINAVMAGALPTAMPILIAGIEALLDPRRRSARSRSAPDRGRRSTSSTGRFGTSFTSTVAPARSARVTLPTRRSVGRWG